MPKIICRYDVCVFNKDLTCTAKQMEYDPDQGCLTAQDRDEFDGLLDDEEEWDADETDEADETDDLEDEEGDDLFDEADDADDDDDF